MADFEIKDSVIKIDSESPFMYERDLSSNVPTHIFNPAETVSLSLSFKPSQSAQETLQEWIALPKDVTVLVPKIGLIPSVAQWVYQRVPKWIARRIEPIAYHRHMIFSTRIHWQVSDED